MSFDLKYNGSSLERGLNKMGAKMGAVILMYAATKAQQLRAQMKMQRPWTDRTGVAKATLDAKVSQPNTNTVRITLSHGVEYGIWLELAHEKNYAIVGPTIREESPKVVAELADIMSKIKL